MARRQIEAVLVAAVVTGALVAGRKHDHHRRSDRSSQAVAPEDLPIEDARLRRVVAVRQAAFIGVTALVAPRVVGDIDALLQSVYDVRIVRRLAAIDVGVKAV